MTRAEDGSFVEDYTEHVSADLAAYMEARPSPSPLLRGLKLRSFAARYVPGIDDLSAREHAPTSAYKLLRILKRHFPRARAIISDFAHLHDTISPREHRAPVVQTRVNGQMVPCSTYLLMKGYFDIFYPTDFEELRRMLPQPNGQPGRVLTHRTFMERYADMEAARTQSGEVPARDMYTNVKMLLT